MSTYIFCMSMIGWLVVGIMLIGILMVQSAKSELEKEDSSLDDSVRQGLVILVTDYYEGGVGKKISMTFQIFVMMIIKK